MPDHSDIQSNNRRIAKNTTMLYVRMLFITAINLYSSRVILEVLGVEDYGTYNVVGGVVSTLSFITASVGSAVSRFITFELGKSEKGDARKMFRCSATIFYIFSILSFVLAETVGLWFVMTKLNIPNGREVAAFWVYQFSVVTFILSLLSITHNALIIAKEKMSAFAYISIYDGLARLAVLYLLVLFNGDRLILYAALLCLLQLSIRCIYVIYCKINFAEADGNWLWNKDLSKEIFTYSGWAMLGHIAIVGYTQGLNILLNIFFGPVVNAARGIATQVQTGLAQLYANFNTAVRPQIVKSYAKGDMVYMHSLVLRSGKISFMLALLLSVPLIAYAEYVLNWWLVNPPEHTVAFVRLTLVACISNSLSSHTLMAIHATGDIKQFQIFESMSLLTILPISWALLHFFQVSPEMVILVYVLVEITTQFVRVLLSYPKIDLPLRLFFTRIIIPSIVTLLLCIIPVWLMSHYWYPQSFVSFVISMIICISTESVIIYLCGLDRKERELVVSFIKRIKHKNAT